MLGVLGSLASRLRPREDFHRKPLQPLECFRQSRTLRSSLLVFYHFQIFSSIKYSDFEFEGKKVFEGMDPKHTELAFMKKKFFQSCLKHIM